jgi:hypothetical protein
MSSEHDGAGAPLMRRHRRDLGTAKRPSPDPTSATTHAGRATGCGRARAICRPSNSTTGIGGKDRGARDRREGVGHADRGRLVQSPPPPWSHWLRAAGRIRSALLSTATSGVRHASPCTRRRRAGRLPFERRARRPTRVTRVLRDSGRFAKDDSQHQLSEISGTIHFAQSVRRTESTFDRL